MLAPGQSGATFHPAGILAYVEKMNRETIAMIDPNPFYIEFRPLLGIRHEFNYFNIVVLWMQPGQRHSGHRVGKIWFKKIHQPIKEIGWSSISRNQIIHFVLQFLTLRQPDKLELLTDFTPLILTLEDIDVLSGGQVVSEDLGNTLEI